MAPAVKAGIVLRSGFIKARTLKCSWRTPLPLRALAVISGAAQPCQPASRRPARAIPVDPCAVAVEYAANREYVMVAPAMTISVGGPAALAVASGRGRRSAAGPCSLATPARRWCRSRRGLAVAHGLLTLAAGCRRAARPRGRRRRLPALGVAVAAILVWFATIQPPATGTGRPTSRRRPGRRSTATGSPSTMCAISPGAPRPTSRRVGDADRRSAPSSRGVDLVASYWMGDAIAHVLVSFEFADRAAARGLDRDQEGSRRSLFDVLGFFKRYELVYVVATSAT